MAAEQRRKTLTYHRAVWAIDYPETINLGQCIGEALSKTLKWEQRMVSRAGGQNIVLARYAGDKNNGYFLHLTVDTPGESASIVPHPAGDAVGIDVAAAPPPNNAEFMDADSFVYINENHLCLCGSNSTLLTVYYFLREFFQRAKIRRDATEFQLLNVLDRQELQKLLQVGVKKIDINGTLYNSSAKYASRKATAIGALATVSKHFKAIFGNENDFTEDAISVALSLTINGSRKGVKLGAERMKFLASDLLLHQKQDDGFSILLKDGKKITPDELILRSTVEIDKMGKSVARDHAWQKLKEFYVGLASAGALVE